MFLTSLRHKLFARGVPESWQAYLSSQGLAYLRMPPSWRPGGAPSYEAFFAAADEEHRLLMELIALSQESADSTAREQVMDALCDSLENEFEMFRTSQRQRVRLKVLNDPAWRDVPNQRMFSKPDDCLWLRCGYRDGVERFCQESFVFQRGAGILMMTVKVLHANHGNWRPLIRKVAHSVRIGRIA